MSDPVDPADDTRVRTETIVLYRRGTYEPAVWFPLADMTAAPTQVQGHGEEKP